MTYQDAVEALNTGLEVRRIAWPKGEYVVDQDGAWILVTASGFFDWQPTDEDRAATDWAVRL